MRGANVMNAAALLAAVLLLACNEAPTAVQELAVGSLDARKCATPPCNTEGGAEAIDYIVDVSSEAAITSGGGVGPGRNGIIEISDGTLDVAHLRGAFEGQCFYGNPRGDFEVKNLSDEVVELTYYFQAEGTDGSEVDYAWTWTGEMDELSVWLPDDFAFVYLTDWVVRAIGPGKQVACEGDGSVNWGDLYLVVVPA